MTSTPPPASLGPVLEFMRSLWALDHALSERARDVGARFGITATQRLVIRILGQSPGTSAGGVARLLHVRPSTLTPVLQQLVSRRVVRRAADPADRRRAVLRLTARGERVDAASASDVDERIRTALSRIAPAEVFHARQVMSAVAEALGDEQPRPGRRQPRSAAPRSGPVARLPAPGTRSRAAPGGTLPIAEVVASRRSSSP